jgi:hypothetical protein
VTARVQFLFTKPTVDLQNSSPSGDPNLEPNMSATNRGGTRHPSDFYSTPSWCVDRLLERVTLPSGAWLEPGAGEGNVIKAVTRTDVCWTAVEQQQVCRAALERITPRPEIIITDRFIDAGVPERDKPLYGRRFEVALGNPPFSLAQEFVEESLRYADTVVMLLRLNFLASAGRCSFMQNRAPDVFVIPDRPSFDGQGTDSIEYAWFVWRSSAGTRSTGEVTVLNTTPLSVRREIRAQHELQHRRQAA